jgi:hypothetical protein
VDVSCPAVELSARLSGNLGRVFAQDAIGPNLHEARQVLAERMWERRNGKFRLNRQPITMKDFAASGTRTT